MDTAQIAELIEKFDSSKSVVLELKTADFSLKLKKEEACRPGEMMSLHDVPPMPPMPPMAVPQAAVQGAPETSADSAGAGAQKEQADYIKAPLVGVFYAAPSPDKEPFVRVGTRVQKGETVCMVEAMKMMSEVAAPKDGTITEILVKNGDFIEFDQPLFAIQE
jgi:acetyl-CoA carboxylase biotin carboxyl carrier protein